MAIREIVKEGEDILRKNCRAVTEYNQRLWDLLDDMAQTMYEASGVGLAAPQVGILRQVVVIDDGNGLLELMNPEIVTAEGLQEGSEGCLSCPGEYGIVRRPMQVKVRAYNRHGELMEYEGEGLLARAFCHEIDHLSGRIFKDLAIRMLDPNEPEPEDKTIR